MKGFIIYPTYRIIDDKAYIYLYGRLENNQSFLTINHFRPYFFIKTSDLKKAKKLDKFDPESTKFTNFKKEPVTKIILDIPSDIPTLRTLFSQKKIECYEADIKFAYRFMIDKKIQGSLEIDGDYETHQTVDRVYKEPDLAPSDYKPKNLKTLSLDIETSTDAKKLYCISLYSENYKKSLIISKKKFKNTISCPDEETLLENFQKIILLEDPDVITGWHVIDFDLNFLKNKFKQHKLPFRLGRDNSTSKIKIQSDFFRDSKADFVGRQVLDGISILKSSFIKVRDYKLDTVAVDILKDKKLISHEDKSKIDKFYKEKPQLLLDYNLKDAKLAYDIIQKSNTLDLTIIRSLLTGMPLDRVSASIASFDSIYLKKARQRNLAVLSGHFSSKPTQVTGGFVMEPKPGIYDNVLVLDFKSLYTSLMRTFNLDPASFLGKKKEKNAIKAPNGVYFRNEEGIVPEIIKTLLEEREKVRKQGNELARYAIKILLNSFWGIFASPSFRFFSMDMANAITNFARYTIKLTAKKIEEMGYEVIYSDSVSGDTEVIIQDKEYNIQFTKIENLFNKARNISSTRKEYDFPNNISVLTLDSIGKSVFKPIEYIMRHKTNKKMYRVWFTNSQYIDVTEDHSLIGYLNAYYNYNKKPMERLVEVKPSEIGKKIKSIINLKRIPMENIKNRSYPKELYEFMGYFIGDGSFHRNKSHQKYNKDYYLGISAGLDQDEIIKRIIKPLKTKGYIKNYWVSKTRKGDITINGLKLINIISKEIRDKKGIKIIPKFLFNETEENICSFLNGLFSSDGTIIIRQGRPIVRFTNTNEEIIKTTSKLLYLCGISNSWFKENKPNKYKGKISETYSKHVVIKDVLSFKNKIGFSLKRKQDRLSKLHSHRSKKNFYKLDFDLTKIKKIEEIKYNDYVYDIEVCEDHRFFANNVLVHNTDSVFVNVNTNSEKEAEKIGKKIETKINDFYKENIKKEYKRKSFLELEFEKNYIRLLMPKTRSGEKGAKKRYAGLVKKNGKEEIEVVGLESKRTDWTEAAQIFQKEILDRIFHKKEISNFVKKFIQDIQSGKYDDKLVYRKQLRKGLEGYSVNPPHLRAARKLRDFKGGVIEYFITTDGPEPKQRLKHKLDYDHYIDKQIKPIADMVLLFFNLNFDDIVKGSKQAKLFSF